MSPKVKLFLAGIMPLIVGYIMNYVIIYLPFSGVIINVIEIGFFVLWGYLAYRLSDKEKNPGAQAFVMCTVGLVMLLLVLYQELIMGQYWFGYLGSATQFYFFPFLTLASTILNGIFSLLMSTIRIWPFYIMIWSGLFLTSYVGCRMKQKRGR